MRDWLMKYSIRRQLAVVFSLLMMGTILLCWFINNTFLEKYYLKDKQKALMRAYQVMNSASNEDRIGSDEFDIEFQKICGRYNIDFVLLDAKTRTLKTSTYDYEYLGRLLLDNLFGQKNSPDVSLLVEEKSYELRIAVEEKMKTEYMEMWGVLDNGNLFLFRIPLESIQESVTLANRFLAYVGIGSAIFSALVILWVSRKITDPVLELAQISQRMIQLDFDAKYTGKSGRELTMLGQNINELSCTLEKTISELKSANNELQRDMKCAGNFSPMYPMS